MKKRQSMSFKENVWIYDNTGWVKNMKFCWKRKYKFFKEVICLFAIKMKRWINVKLNTIKISCRKRFRYFKEKVWPLLQLKDNFKMFHKKKFKFFKEKT
jgi:hypothetical protein